MSWGTNGEEWLAKIRKAQPGGGDPTILQITLGLSMLPICAVP